MRVLIPILLLPLAVSAWSFPGTGGGGGAKAPAIVSDGLGGTPIVPDVASPIPGQAATDSPEPAVKGPTSAWEPYDGLEYKISSTMRIRPAELVPELIMIGVIILYTIWSLLGASLNRARAGAWFAANEKVLKKEFSVFGMPEDKLFDADGGDEFVGWGTGRRGVEKVQAVVKTQALHDPFIVLYQFGMGVYDFSYISGVDRVTITMNLRAPTGTPGSKFCFCLTRRELLKGIRDARWDLMEFTNTSETPSLPPHLIIMTESGDITNAVLRSPDSGLLELVTPGSANPYAEVFESLIITDGPEVKPDEYAVNPSLPTDLYQLVLTLRLPAKKDSALTVPWVEFACNLADVLTQKPGLLPKGALEKLKRKRVDVNIALRSTIDKEKAEVELEKKEIEAAKKKKLEKEALEKKLKGMKKEDRIKYLEKEKEKERKEQLKKMGKSQMQRAGK